MNCYICGAIAHYWVNSDKVCNEHYEEPCCLIGACEICNPIPEDEEWEDIMSIEEIKERAELKRHRPQLCNNPIGIIQSFPSPFEQDEKDIEYLLSRIEIAEKALIDTVSLTKYLQHVPQHNKIFNVVNTALDQLKE